MEKETRLWSMTELKQAQLPMPRGLLAEHFLVPGTLALISGEAGAGKTFLTTFLADAIVTGTPFLGMPTEQARVLYLSEELTKEGYRYRLLHMATLFVDGEFSGAFKTGIRLNWPEGRNALKALIKASGARLVVIDSFSRIHNGNANYDGFILEMFGALEREICIPLGVCILFVHHAGKPDKDQPNDVRGSVALVDHPRDVMVLRRLKEENLRVLSFRKATFGPEPAPIHFRLGSELVTGKTTLVLADSAPSRER
jgi:RecA-family ATPase